MDKNKKIMIFDATLRDGSHALKHQIPLEVFSDYCKEIDGIGLSAIIVGHGNGLGASSIQIGKSLCNDAQILKAARDALKKTQLGVYMIPGFGTIKDDLIPALDAGVDIFKIGSHCTEMDVTKEHIEFLTKQGKDAYGVMMSTHMATNERLLEEAQKLESYGAKGVIFMDSAGALLPNKVQNLIASVKEKTKLLVGYHGHNNLGLSVSNTLLALETGADIIDGTLKGFGAGAGNCQLEAIVAVLQKMGMLQNINLFKMMDVAEDIIVNRLKYTRGLDQLTIVSGLAGVFSAFKNKVYEAAKIYKVDPREIFIELGKRKVVAGQEDIILDVAMNLSQNKNKETDEESFIMESLL